jgi:hypothetical protein
MYEFLSRKGTAIGFGVGFLLVALFLISAFAGISNFNAIPENDPSRFNTNIFNIGLYAAIALTIIAIVVAVVFGLLQIATNFRDSKKGLIGFAILAILAIIFYNTATVETTGPVAKAAADFGVGPNIQKVVSAGIGICAVLSIGLVLSIVISEVRNLFK